MPDRRPTDIEERVLILAPTDRDARLCTTLLGEAGLTCHPCADLSVICSEMAAGAGAAVLAEEAIDRAGRAMLVDHLRLQPDWSDFPLLVLTHEGAASPGALRTLDALGNVTLLERPVRVATLVSSVLSALRARRRQYQIRGHLAESQRVTAALRDTDRRKDEFLAMLAHELRNPLAPIRNALYILQLRRGADPLLNNTCAMITRQVEHLVRLVDDLLDVSRLLRGKINLRLDDVDLAEVIARAVETTRPLIGSQGHELNLSLPAYALRIRGDAVRLTQVFTNLLNNAAKYTERGGLIELSADIKRGEAVVRVRDTGIGISAEMLTRVFDLFAQAEQSLDRSQGGLGLGLTLVRRLVEMHRGTVEAASAGLGRGSTFVVRLPGAHARPANAETVPADEKTSYGSLARRILIVDDNVDAAESLAQALALDGHDVQTVYDGITALRACQGWAPDVVLLDIGLPGLDGYETARRLRSQAGSAAVTLVAVTGFAQEADRQRSREAGFDAHLSKPVDFGVLRQILAAGSPCHRV